LECEDKTGNYKNLESLLNDTKFKYYCPLCKKKTINPLLRSKAKKLSTIGSSENLLKKKRAASKVSSIQNGKKINKKINKKYEKNFLIKYFIN